MFVGISFQLSSPVGHFQCRRLSGLLQRDGTQSAFVSELVPALFDDIPDSSDVQIWGLKELLYPFLAVDRAKPWHMTPWNLLIKDLFIFFLHISTPKYLIIIITNKITRPERTFPVETGED